MKKILLIVDVQNDFCPGGSLACPDGDKIVSEINRLINEEEWDLVIATQDWHPRGHCSFAPTHGVDPFTVPEDYCDMVWPVHCEAGTYGAELHGDLDQTKINLIVRKGLDKDVDSYSAFADNNGENPTVLKKFIDLDCVLYVCGIATEVCVKHTVMDAINMAGVIPIVVESACAGVTAEGHEEAIKEFWKLGAIVE